jgi:3-dehydroquinate synthase
LVVTSTTVAGLHLDTLRAALDSHPHEVLVLPDGDAAKTLPTVEAIASAAVAARVGRDGNFIALGGGAIGDVTGFAASVFHRGIGFIQAPTTLLSQVDSAVGGKTAVNHPLGKNLIGAFHQPRLVVADTSVLDTLPGRTFASGLAEVIKTGLLDGGLFADLERGVERLVARDRSAVTDVVARCVRYKAAVVAADETEQGGRVLLNLGHTFGHALETHYAGKLEHGEAVGIGCLMAARLSRSLGWLDPGLPQRLQTLLTKCGLPTSLPEPIPESADLLDLMGRDKKNRGGRTRLVLLRALGEAVTSVDHPHAALVLTLDEFTGGAA